MPDLPTPILDATPRLYAVEAGMATLRRGMPAILAVENADDFRQPAALALLAAETADASGLAALDRSAAEPPVLLLALPRAAALLPIPLPPDRSWRWT